MRRHEVKARRDADARAFRALALLRACCLAIACLCATFVLELLLWGLGVQSAWLTFAIASLAAAGLAPRMPWLGVGVVAPLTATQMYSLLAAPTVPGMRMLRAALSREGLGWLMPRTVDLLPRAGIVVLGLIALGSVVGAGRDLSATPWHELLASHPQRRRTHLLLVGAGLLVGMMSLLGGWVGYRVERGAEEAAVRNREDLIADMKSAFQNAWNAADLEGVVACFPEAERLRQKDVLPAYLHQHGYDPWPQIEFAREADDDLGRRRIYYREAGSDAEPFLLTEWEICGPRWVLSGIRVRKR